MARIQVRVTPRATRTRVGPMAEDGVLAVRVSAPPVDGAANAAVTRAIADAFGLAARDVVLVAGSASRLKVVELPLPLEEIRRRLADHRT